VGEMEISSMNFGQINRIKIKGRSLVLLLLFVFAYQYSFSQPYRWRKKPEHTWILGLGVHAIDDYNVSLGQVFSGNRTWHFVPYPARFSFERNLKYGFGITGLLHYNQYLPGKYVNEVVNNQLFHVASFDAMLKYRFNMRYKRVAWFDPYIGIGLGYTMKFGSTTMDNVTTNVHIGTNFWFTQKIGMQIETSAKFALGATYPAHEDNYLQHSVSFLYRIYPNSKKKRDKAHYKWTKKKPKSRINRI